MIEFPRSLARQLWAVLRRCLPKARGARPPLVEFAAGLEGLRVRVAHHEVAVEFFQPGALPEESLFLPLDALAAFEGRGEDTITLEAGEQDGVVAHWRDGGVPQAVEYAVPDPDKQPAFPDLPHDFTPNPPGLLQALDEAARTAAQDGVRFALQRLQLRGRTGEVVATDGKQLLIQGGFEFPWAEDVLVTRVAAFGCRELGHDTPVEVGKTKQDVAMRVGPWTFVLHIDAEAHYPQTEQIVPRPAAAATHWRLDPQDAVFLAHALPRLPGKEEENQPLTVDLDGEVSVRARASGQEKVTEVVLARSDFDGKPVRLCLNRQFLARAIQLGFGEFQIPSADKPLVCRDNNRVFLAMPLSKDEALAPSKDALRLLSFEGERPRPNPNPERKKIVMAAPLHRSGNGNGNGNGHGAPPRKPAAEPQENGQGHAGSVIAEAQALKDVLRDSYQQACRLVAALKRQRKQSKLVQSTIASLRQLQHIDS